MYFLFLLAKLKDKPNHIAVVTGGGRGIGKGVVEMLMKCDMHVVIGKLEVANEFLGENA